MRISEIVDLTEAVIDEAVNPFLLTNVKIVGLKSLNNREYPIKVLKKAAPLYESCPVYVDHTDKRKYTDRVGNLKNITTQTNGLYGDLQLNPKHTLSESISWDFVNNSKNIGLSHVVEADMDGNKVISINKVSSADLVANPATTASLREEEETDIEKMNKVLDELHQSVRSLSDSNEKLMNEVAEMRSKKPVSYQPQYNEPAKVDIQDWLRKLQRKN